MNKILFVIVNAETLKVFKKCAYCEKSYELAKSDATHDDKFCNESCEHKYYDAREAYQR
jgi:hypothetical protein